LGEIVAPASVDRELMAEIHKLVTEMGHYELKVMRLVANRVKSGQREQGLLYPKKKNWIREAEEEAADLLVYLAMQRIRQDEGS
jgi:hypothetical protein